MSERRADREGAFEDPRTWRRLLARLHPDAGGDHELFLFACALKDDLCARPQPLDGPHSHAAPERESYLRVWRSGLNSWASRNRDALRTGRPRRYGARQRRSRDTN